MFGTQYQKKEKIRIVQMENLRLPIDPQKVCRKFPRPRGPQLPGDSNKFGTGASR